jgi:predicted nucleic acid-binding protein
LWSELLSGGEPLLTTSYVVLETIALLQRRLGLVAVRAFREDAMRPLAVHWVGQDEHEALAELLWVDRRGVSLVDHVSFLAMRRLGIARAFAFDGDFPVQGFEVP